MRNGCLDSLASRATALRAVWRRAGTLTAGCALALAVLIAPQAARAADPVEVVKLLLADQAISAGGQQILQITLRSLNSKPVRTGLRVEMRDSKDARIGNAIDRVVVVNGLSEQREFFRFEAPNRFGRFTVRVEVFTPDFKSRLLAGDPVFYAPFQVGSLPEPGMGATPKKPGPKEPGAPQTPPGPPTFAPPRGLNFEKPDLVWENLDIQPAALLVGEPLKVKVDLRNVGGDIARGIDVKVDYFNTRTPGNLIPIARQTVPVLAPGDKVEMNFEAEVPESAPLGDYKVILVIDPSNRIAETNKENNTLVSEVPIRLSLIKQIFPEPGYYFEQTGLFLFRWDSRRFDEFKVQVGTDPAFKSPDSSFDIPQGEKWTKDHEVVPLEGELPDMALGLMEKARASQLYWRVLGRSVASGTQSVSAASPFFIRKTMGKSAQDSGTDSALTTPPTPPPADKPRAPGPQTVEPDAKPAQSPQELPAAK
jgi:CARDB